ncbi:toxic anion resistance protein [Lacticaseibacillus rhamnosus]|uniref:Toxic anion resistance protein n=6 Tax=Lacticaseibacillus rhamnosus TaxID=47715 RepID=A0A0J6X246_LACRH|nr:toxic anion resistance protein [Lacticaseibacillus rhamnosus]OFJ98957.1 tellurite resistance protein TelA [Lactobacillus sp. HMSC066G01]OFM26014.1 tellurite resistance protein TelA [Lactobacillus sp. HMSC078F07]OFM70326.1 tellurite resistance protein TelA [Lactobacillus sp. HMSC064F12]OFM92688.1 tellurite resistance protein TelA [Lactobacillus sp. HMSC068B07]OFN11065.1 tellurite resistance protein TelA [Lactobacillus sp. HMSC072E07]OFO56737.1 tellurite resistance protein TelA [Lactobacillu
MTNVSDDKQTNLTDDLLADPFSTATDATAEPNIPEATTAKPKLNPEQEAKARDLASKIDVTKGETVLNYGADAQKQLGVFSQNMLTKVQSQDTGAVGDALTSLMTRLNEANPDELKAENNNIFRKIFGRVKRSIYEITAKYQKIGAQIDTIANRLETSQQGLLNDNKLLDELYDQNKAYFDALNIYIEAANLKIAELNEKTIPEAAKAAEAANDQMAIQQVNDLKQFASRLEKRAYDLQLARQITIQQAPQIRLIQNTNQALAEKIQASVNTAIPLWKNQVAIALTLLRQKNAVTAQRQVSETTNDLLKKNSEMLKISSIETAKENERGVVDIETLTQTQNDLIDTLKQTLQIQQDGRLKRQNAEKQLVQMEGELKQQLLNYTHGSMNEQNPKDVTPH